MRYTKPHLSFGEQAQLLINRGLEAEKEELEGFLMRVNYYRFTGYLYPFRMENSENYAHGTQFRTVKKIYDFDSELRLMTLASIETIDVTILRTRMVEMFTRLCGAFCYVERSNYDDRLSEDKHREIMDKIERNAIQSSEEFVNQYREKYIEETHFPFWMVAELCSIGTLSTIFKYLPNRVKTPISRDFNLHSEIFVSWLHTLSNVRNFCAHHGRLWNRTLPIKPSIPSEKFHPEFYTPNLVGNSRFFIVLVILNYLCEIILGSKEVGMKFRALTEKYPETPLHMMGFPENWHEYPLLKLS